VSNLSGVFGRNWTKTGKFNNGSGVGGSDIQASALAGLFIEHLWVSSTDTIDHELQLIVSAVGGSSITVGGGKVPAGSGFGVLPAIDLIEKILPGSGGLAFQQGDVIQISIPVIVTSPDNVYWFATGQLIP